MKLAVALLSIFALGACQTPWGRYDETLYSSVFQPSEQTISRHIQTLEGFTAWEIPPPGFCAELAYYLVLAGREAEADAWLERELMLWPESAMVVAALRNLIAESGEEEPVSEELES
jgi:hypothetical protein